MRKLICLLSLLCCGQSPWSPSQPDDYNEFTSLYHGLLVSIRVPDFIWASEGQVPVMVKLKNTGSKDIIMPVESYLVDPSRITMDTVHKTVNLWWLYDDLRPEYGLPSMEGLKPSAEKMVRLNVRLPYSPKGGDIYRLSLALGFLESDSVSGALLDTNAQKHYVVDSLYGHLISLHERTVLGPLPITFGGRKCDTDG